MSIVYNYGSHLFSIPNYGTLNRHVQQVYMRNQVPLFISGWDSKKSVSQLKDVSDCAWTEAQNDINRYINVEEDYINSDIINYISRTKNIDITSKQIMISGSASSLIALSILSLSVHAGTFLIIAPTYFSFTDILPLIQNRAIIVSPNQKNEIDYTEIESILNRENIIAIVITDPIFGYGICMQPQEYEVLIKLSNKHHAVLICDFAREGPSWNSFSPLLGKNLEYLIQAERFIAIYSPCKKLDINGLKTGVLLATAELVYDLQNYSDAILGSLSAPQIHFFRLLLKEEFDSSVQKQCDALVKIAKSNYETIKSLFIGTHTQIIKPSEGFFAVTKVPKTALPFTDDLDIFDYYLQHANIITLPLSLYYFPNTLQYCFRVNLLLEKVDLLKGMSAAITLENIL